MMMNRGEVVVLHKLWRSHLFLALERNMVSCERSINRRARDYNWNKGYKAMRDMVESKKKPKKKTPQKKPKKNQKNPAFRIRPSSQLLHEN